MFSVSSITTSLATAFSIEALRLRAACAARPKRRTASASTAFISWSQDRTSAGNRYTVVRRDLGAVIEFAKLGGGVQVVGAEIADRDQVPVMQLLADRLLPPFVLEDAGGGIVVPDLVVEPPGWPAAILRKTAASRAASPTWLVDLEQIETMQAVPIDVIAELSVWSCGPPISGRMVDGLRICR